MNILGLNISLNRNSKIKNQKSPGEVPVSQLSSSALAWMRGEPAEERGAVISNGITIGEIPPL